MDVDSFMTVQLQQGHFLGVAKFPVPVGRCSQSEVKVL